MSGGVDSSVAALLLKQSGLEVEGVSFILYEARMKKTFSKAPCCSIAAMDDARLTARQLGVDHHTIDMREVFMEKVIEPFMEAYSRGVTPNPCILCNKYVKFPYLLSHARERGAALISTGDYARVQNRKLLKGVDVKKDQSYVLYVLSQDELGCLRLPLGGMRKDEVRQIARGHGLAAAARPESQEICFIEERNYCTLFQSLPCTNPGPIIDVATGRVIGEHRGVHLYTVGQRKRLGIAALEPRYVAKIDGARNALYVGPREAALARECEVEDLNWFEHPPACMPDEGTCSAFRATVKVRSAMRDEPAMIVDATSGGANRWQRVRVRFDEAQWAPAPGQSAVFYDGDRVIGGGVIAVPGTPP